MPKALLTRHTQTKPNPNKNEKYVFPLICWCCVSFLFLVAASIQLYLYFQRIDFSLWEPSTCILERVEVMTTETVWDPFDLIDTRKNKVPTKWGYGVVAIVSVTTNDGLRSFTGGGNDCGVFTYTDRCSCSIGGEKNQSTCYQTRLGGMNWTDCPSDPWCDVQKAIPGPCVGQLKDGHNINGCTVAQKENGKYTGKTITACSNHQDAVTNRTYKESVKIPFDCWVAPKDTVPPYKGRLSWTDRSLYKVRGQWIGVRFTSPQEECKLSNQDELQLYFMLGLGLTMPFVCFAMFLIYNSIWVCCCCCCCCMKSKKVKVKDCEEIDQEEMNEVQMKLQNIRGVGGGKLGGSGKFGGDSKLNTLEKGDSTKSLRPAATARTGTANVITSRPWLSDTETGSEWETDESDIEGDGNGTEYIYQDDDKVATESRVEIDEMNANNKKKKKRKKRKRKKNRSPAPSLEPMGTGNVKRKKIRYVKKKEGDDDDRVTKKEKPLYNEFVQPVQEIKKVTLGSYYDHRKG